MVQTTLISKRLDKRLLIIILLWAFVFSLFIGGTFFITWKFEDRGTALKDLGDLNSLVLSAVTLPPHALESTVTQLKSITTDLAQNSVFCCYPIHQEFLQFQNLLQSYQTHLQAQSSVQKNEILNPSMLELAQSITQQSASFAQQIDGQNTHHIHLLRAFRWGLVSLIAFSFFLSFKLLKRFFLQPLNALNLGLVQVKRGNLQTRIQLPSSLTEWYTVAQEFNQMTQELEKAREQQYRKEAAILEERNLISQRLHDSVAQSLAFVKMQASALKKESAVVANSPHFALMEKGISHCHEDIRALLQNFRHKIAYDNFPGAILAVLNQYRQLHHLTINETLDIQHISLNEDQQLQIIFILQETLSNTVKHAHASQVWVQAYQEANYFHLNIQDNGCGFDLQQPISGEHIGIAIMRERANNIKAQLTIESAQPHGTSLSLTVPCS